MMAYDDQFVLAVMHDGSPIREFGGKVTLPFNSEYKIRLKNKNRSQRAKARVWIDGRKVSNLGDFILHPGETLNLERFLDESMSSGNRFKFVPLSDSRVNDPTDSDNGVIKVEFYREEPTFKIDWDRPPIKPQRRGPYKNNPGDYTRGINTGGRLGFTSSTTTISNSINCFTSSTLETAVPISHEDPSAAGATVEGSNSNQQFVTGDDFVTETFPITLTLRIKGLRKQRIKPTPKQRPKPSPFCGECGTEKLRRKDKFCRGCGHKLYRG